VLNAGTEPIVLPPGDLLLASGPLTSLTTSADSGGLALPPDTAAWLAST